MLSFHKIKGSSIIIFSIKNENMLLGTLILTTDDKDFFKEDHTELLLLLKEPFVIAVSNALRHMEIIKLSNILQDDNRYLYEELLSNVSDVIIGSKFGLKKSMGKVRQVAALESPVLITGETGAGKDVIAVAIHQSSLRCDKPFIVVNCGAIPDGLIDSELFGHEKGAFTGAVTKKRGRFERANK